MPDIFSMVDDKHIPLYRVLWIADTPHFCGSEECEVEGRYEIRLESDESVFGTRDERDKMMSALAGWHGGNAANDEQDWA